MSVILGIDHLNDYLTAVQLEKLDLAAGTYKTQSNIEFLILQVTDDIIVIEATQLETRSGKYANEASLVKKTHELFDKPLSGFIIEVKAFPFLPSPTSIVTPQWLETKMKEKDVRIKQIAFDTGVDRDSIAGWVAGKRTMSQIVKAMFFFYLME